MRKEDTLNLVVIDDSANDLELVSNMLRNAGHAVHTRRVEDDQDLREALSEQRWDLILAKPEIPYFTARAALAVLERQGEDVPMLVLSDNVEYEAVEAVLDAGAHDAVSLNRTKRMLAVILREVGALHDRRDLRHCYAQLREAEHRAHELTESSRDAIAYVQEGMHVYANPAYLEMFGYAGLDEIEGVPVIDMVVPDDQHRLKEFLRAYFKEGAHADNLTVHGQRLDGAVFEMTLELSPTTYRGEHCIQAVIRDQSVNKELARKLDDLSKHDLLTGVYNRQHFLERIKQDVASARHRGAVLYIRPDNFRALSDELGVAASDMLIADMATELARLLPAGDHILARFEAHTFTVLLYQTGEEEARHLASRVVQAVAGHLWETGGRTVDLTVSVGVALYDEQTRDPQRVLFQADKARRMALEAGGNRSHLHSPADEHRIEQQQRKLWAEQLKLALKNNSFRLLYQPIVNLRDERTEAYEVLLRLLDDQGNEIAASDFFPAAQELGLANALDRWVLLRAVKVLAERRKAGNPTRFFVKLSAQSLTDTRFLSWLSELRQGCRLEPGALVLEVHEEAAHDHLKAVRRFAEGLNAMHVAFALDHFGQAPGWEHLLQELPASYLKVHADLIRGLTGSKHNQDRLKAIVEQSGADGKSTIAQFVEDAETLAVLWRSGVDYVEGYFLQAPAHAMTYDFAATA